MTEDEWYRLGLSLHASRRWGAAAGCFARAGMGYEALTNFGWNRHMAGRSEEALDVLLIASQVSPPDGVVLTLQGQLRLTFGDDVGALRSARLAVEQGFDSPIAHTALAFALFFSGQWEEGWREYEWRYRYRPEQYPPRPQPLWRGEAVDRLWVEAEQGFGDTIFGLRWLKEARERVGKLLFFVQPELYGWVREWVDRAGVEVELAPLPRPLPEAEAWCPMLSLPAAMGVGFPVPGWPAIKFGKPRRVGINWRGNPAHEQAHHRDIPLPYWLPLTENMDIELHSFQFGGSQELADLGMLPLVRDRAPEITNFLDASRLLTEVDLLVTVDTALAHLAAEMGKPVWLLINQRGQDFRWGRGSVTPWYGTMDIWRRGLDEDWAAVMGRVGEALR